jgi:hypothetical protein
MPQSTLALDVFVPPLAPAVVLAFLGAGALLAASAVGSAIALAGRRFRLAKVLVGAGLVVAVGYAALLFGAALISDERTLRPGEKKYFCEIDCHLAYSIAGSQSAGPRARAVTLTTWFDPSTIASFRGNAPLTPNPRVVCLVDDSGRRYAPSALATRTWEERHGASTPLTRELRPGESYTTTFVFELPEGARRPRLLLADPVGIETLLIGHENSPSHGKAYFELPGETL